ncbi:helix-turn-helix domain-containing protein [uncultured Enterovirga sp.]|uniref:helix-turn-helix domain-containing protein n=1 Tax=uncultured Enterovirga sp. TaxID=2026352 RepID=UPI0035C9442F
MNVDGEKSDLSGVLSTGLCFFPAFAPVLMDAEFQETSDYAVAFFDDLQEHPESQWTCLQRALVGFRHAEIERSFAVVCREAVAPDGAFDLLVEGWAMQVRGYLGRAMAEPLSERSRPRANQFSGPKRRMLEEYLRLHLDAKIQTTDLASVVGLGSRQFSRAFFETFRETPYRHVLAMRIDRAKQLLLITTMSITEIAFACGFSQAQHFTTAFKRIVGTSPSMFRHSCLT